MTTIGTTNTLMDLARRLDPDNKIATIIEIMHDDNEILDDIQWKEGNLLTGEKTTQRTSLPSVVFRQINEGVSATKSTTKQITDSCAMIEGFSKVDKKLVELNGNTAAYRMSEDKAFLESMQQTFATALMYGNEATDPEQFTGFAPRYATPSDNNREPGYNMIDAGGTGSDNSSIFLVSWGENRVYGIYPKGSTAGFQHTDMGEDVFLDSSDKEYVGLRSHYRWECGLTVKDWRSIVRICNIDMSNLVAETSAADLIKLMIKALEVIPAGGRPVFYVPQRVRMALRLQILDKTNVNLTFENVAGRQALTFAGAPVRRVDALLATEARITGTFFGW